MASSCRERSSYVTDLHTRSTTIWSRARPRPSILIAIPVRSKRLVNARLLNWTSWSGLNISGPPYPSALSRASRQTPVQGIGQLPGQPISAAPVENRHQIHEPLRHGYVRHIRPPNPVGAGDLHRTQQRGRSCGPARLCSCVAWDQSPAAPSAASGRWTRVWLISQPSRRT